MEEGTVVRWLKAGGESVRRGEEIVEIETDKATMSCEAVDDGVLEIVVSEGDTVSVGTLLARVHADGALTERPPQQGAERELAEPINQLRVASGASAAGLRVFAGVKAAPLARRIATERGLDLDQVTGSGPGGRILRADVEGDRATVPTLPVGASRANEDGSRGKATLEELTSTQKLIARRTAASNESVPDFTLEREIDMEGCVQLRSQLAALESGETPPTYNDMIVKACAIALREHPRTNGSYRDDGFELHERVDVGFAVATDDALIVPTVFDADRKSLSAIAAETRTLTDRARARMITPGEISGATFTVSNLGMLGVDRFTAVISAPQAAILATGAIKMRPVARGSEVVARATLSATLICDHRILYGADGARFLARIAQLLEHPLVLCVSHGGETSAPSGSSHPR